MSAAAAHIAHNPPLTTPGVVALRVDPWTDAADALDLDPHDRIAHRQRVPVEPEVFPGQPIHQLDIRAGG